MAEGHEGEGHLTLRIDVQEAVHIRVHEAAHDPGRQTQGGRNGKQIGK